ncbi:MAG: serine hydrolase domain-containing protein [Verrucomicrobiales bacterium]
MTVTQSSLGRVLDVFERNFAERNELGASVSIWQHGEEILAHSAGWCEREKLRPWTGETLVPVWSATKGAASACVLHALAAAEIPLEQPVSKEWPEFAACGKSSISYGQLLSHQAGLVALDIAADSFDYPTVIQAIEQQVPNWVPGNAHGYHPRTFGYLLDEIVRRSSGAASLGEYWRDHFAAPLGLDFWIGLPEREDARVAKLYAGRMHNAPDEKEFYRAFADAESLSRRAFASPTGIAAVTGMNEIRAQRAGLPAMGGVGSASSLGKFYALLASGGEWQGRRYLSDDILAQAETTRVSGIDLTFQLQTAFSAGFMRDPVDAHGSKLRQLFGPEPRAFGHPGAGGSHAFADPENGIAFAYTMNQMSYGVLPNARSLEMIEALYDT